MKRILTGLTIALLMEWSMPAFAQNGIVGVWLNPRGTVAVRTGECAGKLCGWIIWAAAEAKSDARESGVNELIGTELLEDYRFKGGGIWSGSVYVPDMGYHFSSTLMELNPGELKIRGCLIGRFICKSQIWRRIEKVPNA